MTAIPAAIALVGVAGSAYMQSKAAGMNANLLDVQAGQTEAQAKFDEGQQRRESALYMGDATARTAASGFSISSGSPLLQELDRVKQTEIQALNIRRGGSNAANVLRFQGGMSRSSIPWIALGGAAKGGSILSKYAYGAGYYGD